MCVYLKAKNIPCTESIMFEKTKYVFENFYISSKYRVNAEKKHPNYMVWKPMISSSVRCGLAPDSSHLRGK